MSSSPPPRATPAPTSPPSTNSTSPPPSSAASPPPSTSSTPPPATPSPPTPSASSPPPSSSTSPSTPTTTSPPPPSSSSPSPPSPSTSTTPRGSGTPSRPPPSRSSGNPSRPPPSRSSGTPSRSSPPSESSNGVSTGLVIGIAIGGVAILLVLSLFCICCKKKSRRRRRDDESYYMPPLPPGPKDDPYGGQQYRVQQNPPPPVNQSSAVPTKPSPPPVTAWRPQAMPPPPLFMSSSGGSGSNYSGSENPLPPPSPGIVLGFSKNRFTYEELARATDGFSDTNLLGQGGFGYVHRGVLPNGKQVAVKQLKAGSGQGEREFHAEVEIISRVHHKHLVSLVGYCISGTTRMLVYEFVPNNTLEFHLHGKGRLTIDWPTRMRIALGSAKGLAYLHEDCHPKIIHRDIKAANILLDFKFEAKVADFGLAKFSSDANTHVSTRVMGTFGGKLTDKSDVFSFGVMLLELITGHRPVGSSYREDSLVDWARPLLTRAMEDGNYDSLADPKLQKEYNHNEMTRMVACAAACVRHSARRRPRMSQIVRALEGDASLSDLNEGVTPEQSSVYSSYESSDYDTNQYNEDMKRFRRMALDTQEYAASSEYSEATTEYGLYPSGSSYERQTTREMEMRKMMKNSQGFSGNSTS
ncbi:hypothetical protein E1A91_D06G073900v1 [Gossypium mustelinum]|uniref:non-specific serine/threonine protein kinase n=1 Tax=Gossypium mustelinum TaxID=34275 RepID=A0A5D2UGL3_GOSMU|nr:hypothetical protein E1A91_D06G073900v1 [Gossypium mustelinum]